MKQQINLYQERFRPRHVVLPARRIVLVELVLLGVLAIVSAAMQWSVERTGATRARLEAQAATLKQGNAKLQQAVDRQSIDEDLQARVARTNSRLQARKKVLEWVTDSQTRNKVRFSALLEGPGRRHVQGLWLSGIKIEQAGAALQLTGNVLDPKLVPEFLTALREEPAYSGREFRKLVLEDNDDAAGMRFLLTTRPPDQNAVTLNGWGNPPKRRAGR